jgi:hypothetical protein
MIAENINEGKDLLNWLTSLEFCNNLGDLQYVPDLNRAMAKAGSPFFEYGFQSEPSFGASFRPKHLPL